MQVKVYTLYEQRWWPYNKSMVFLAGQMFYMVYWTLCMVATLNYFRVLTAIYPFHEFHHPNEVDPISKQSPQKCIAAQYRR
jgi:hypothetical protein